MPTITSPWLSSTWGVQTAEEFEEQKAAFIRQLNERANEYIKSVIQQQAKKIINKITEIE